jgi:hypothetical protein
MQSLRHRTIAKNPHCACIFATAAGTAAAL